MFSININVFFTYRFAEIRSTQQGKLEERLPFFSFTFPPWFKSKYPEAYNNFKENAHRLTTPFDINKTLRNVLHFEGGGVGTLEERAISLFKKVFNFPFLPYLLTYTLLIFCIIFSITSYLFVYSFFRLRNFSLGAK